MEILRDICKLSYRIAVVIAWGVIGFLWYQESGFPALGIYITLTIVGLGALFVMIDWWKAFWIEVINKGTKQTEVPADK